MFGFIKKLFIKLLSLSFGRSLVSGNFITEVCDHTKCISLNN